MKGAAVVLLLVAVFAVALALPTLKRSYDPSMIIDGEYILVFHDYVSDDSATEHMTNLTKSWTSVSSKNLIKRSYKIGTTFRAFAAALDASALNEQLQSPLLNYIEHNHRAELFYNADSCSSSSVTPWGLARVSSRTIPANNARNLVTPKSEGSNVRAYVIDTGIRSTHDQFDSRVEPGKNFVSSWWFPSTSSEDDNGHGTHCAGTIGGSSFGVARKVTLIAAKVLAADGSGSYDGVIDGINWVASDAAAHRPTPSLASLSLGGPRSDAVNQAVDAAVATGLTFVVAAGNDNADACNYSPASADSVISVGATDSSDMRSPFSNCGSCVDVVAPGSAILSAWYTGDNASNTISGTSMATPHVSGVAALYLSEHPTATPAEVKEAVLSRATSLYTSGDWKNCPKKLVYIGDC